MNAADHIGSVVTRSCGTRTFQPTASSETHLRGGKKAAERWQLHLVL